MNNQEIFTKVYTTLRDRGFTRAVELVEDVDPFGTPYSREICRLRSPNGPCAIGILLPDEVYKPYMEGCSLSDSRSLSGYFLNLGYDLNFLQDLQAAHDRGKTPDDMENNLKFLAFDNDLEMPT